MEDVDGMVGTIAEVVQELRKISPLGRNKEGEEAPK